MMDLLTVIKKVRMEWKHDPRFARDELEVISKYGQMFQPENIDNLTAEDYKSFLNFRNNKYWTGM